MEFKDVLKKLRAQKSLSQVELSKGLGYSPGMIGMLENGTRKPSYEALEAIADYFNVTLDYLTGKDDRSVYYADPVVMEMANQLKDNPGLRVLFDAAKDVSPEELQAIVNLINIKRG